MYRPHSHLATLTDVAYVVMPLPAGRSWWLPAQRAIVVAKGLVQRDRRSALAHEIAHAERGDTCAADHPDAHRAQERAADAVAAHRMIPLEALAGVLATYGNVGPEWIPTLAEELHVSDELLRFRLAHLHPSEEHHLRQVLADREEAP